MTEQNHKPKVKQAKDITGQVFNRVTALRFVEQRSYAPMWECQCLCGQIFTTSRYSLQKGLTQSCGCLHKEIMTTHGNSGNQDKSPAYMTWGHMIQRCTNPSNDSYHHYGGRGITVCGRWLDFTNFLADMGERPKGKTLDRFPDNNGNYEPENCRWASRGEQARNKRNNHLLTFEGKTMCMKDWAIERGLSLDAVRHRLKDGWTVEDALTKPIQLNQYAEGTRNCQQQD